MEQLGHEEEGGHENHERYLITYADMITLLLALFIILFAIGQVDLAKFERFRSGLNKAFGAPGLEGGTGVLEDGTQPIETPQPEGELAVAAAGLGEHVTQAEAPGLARQLEQALAGAGLHGGVSVTVTERGVLILLSTDDVTFVSGAWDIRPEGRVALDALAGPLGAIDNAVVVEGHTDDRPMPEPLTNWELSGNRAAAVVRHLEGRGIAAPRMTIAGYADTRPRGDNTTPAGRAQNRRVEILVPTDPGT